MDAVAERRCDIKFLRQNPLLYVHRIDQKTKFQLTVAGFPILKVGTLSTRTGEEEDAFPEVKSRISIAVRMRIGCIIPSCPRLRREVRSFDVVDRT